mgnify:FL=1
MKDIRAVFSALRKNGKGQYKLLSGCLFFGSLLITAFCMMMYSPTVQNTLPQGGDSRKQVMMIFILAVIGCAAFSVYASGLFFRYKSRETGVFLALGLSRKTLGQQLRREVIQLAVASCGAGLILGTPLCWLIWSLFRLSLVDTPEMALIFDLRAYLIPLAFLLFVLTMLLVMQKRFLARVNVLDIIQESHRAEPVRAVPQWYGWGGILMIAIGCLLGYFVPSFCVRVLHWYAPAVFTAPFYLPALIGLYWVLLYTVVGGWHRGKNRYTHLIESGMMQFQGRQTVRNMLVVTVLVAGAYFASFYTPMMIVPGRAEIENRPVNYQFFYRADQDMITNSEIEEMASDFGAKVIDYVEMPSASLAIDGEAEVETEGPLGTTYTNEYREIFLEHRFFSVSSWNALTGDDLVLEPGECAATLDYYGDILDISLVTNPVTMQQLSVITLPEPLPSELFQDTFVLTDEDYASITQGLTPDWQEVQVLFNAENDSYAFSKALLHSIVAHSGPETAVFDGYDRISRMNAHKAGEEYWGDQVEELNLPIIDLSQPDTSDFQLNWLYMPKFQALDDGNFLSNFAVFLLLFVFVAILCFGAVGVILYTRSQTLMLSNAWVYEDLRKLGASNRYLKKTAQGQIKRVFFSPILIGTVLMLGFYTLILLANGGDMVLDQNERMSLSVCLLVVAAMSAVFYGFYRFTLNKSWHTLHLSE